MERTNAIEVGFTRFENVDKFTAWLDVNLKCPYGTYDLDAVLEEVQRKHGVSGSEDYELSGWETNSGHPEIYYYDYSYEVDEYGDLIKETFTF